MAEGLRKVAQLLAGEPDLFAKQTEVVRVGVRLFEGPPHGAAQKLLDLVVGDPPGCTNLGEFEEAIRQAHDNGASRVTYFRADSLKDSHLAVIKKYNEAYNR